MGTKLKTGQRIGVFNVTAEIPNYGLKGKTIVAERETYPEEFGGFNLMGYFCPYYAHENITQPEYMECALLDDEVKQVGTFIVKEAKTNTDPITII